MLIDMLEDVLIAEKAIEADRIARKRRKWRLCVFRQGGLLFICIGYYRLSFCKVKG